MLTRNALGTIHQIERRKSFPWTHHREYFDLVEHMKDSFADRCIQVCRSIHQEIGINSVLVEDDWSLFSFDCSTQQYPFVNVQHRSLYFRLSCSLVSGRFNKLIHFPLNWIEVSSLTFWPRTNCAEGFHDWRTILSKAVNWILRERKPLRTALIALFDDNEHRRMSIDSSPLSFQLPRHSFVANYKCFERWTSGRSYSGLIVFGDQTKTRTFGCRVSSFLPRLEHCRCSDPIDWSSTRRCETWILRNSC